MNTKQFHSLLAGLTLVATTALVACQPIRPVSDQTVSDHPASTHTHDATHTHSDAALPAGVAPLLGNLGTHSRPISSKSALAQKYFDEGLNLTYGFNHAEAIRSYSDAAKIDPDCAICYWGIAYALGPNINALMDPAAVPPAWEALQQAIKLAPKASQAEQAYIQALTKRYTDDPTADRAPLEKAFAEAMRDLAKAYPDDLDAATLYAESLMNLMPWNFWTKEGQPTEYTNEIVSTLESVLARNPNHPGANHFYIHAVEASQTPERAIPSADRLTTLVPGAGHLVHMPGHIYWRVGRYQDVITSNEHAVHSDETYIPDRNAQGIYVVGYYPHNIHFLSCAAQILGDSQLAIEWARKLAEKLPDPLVVAVPLMQSLNPMPLFALVRFGKWDEILAEPQPTADLRYATGIWHWARGMAYIAKGEPAKAEDEYKAVSELAQMAEMKELAMLGFTTGEINLTLASHILASDIAGAKGDAETQISEMEAAVKVQDSLPYVEPPAWYFPTRDMLGAALLKAGRAVDAETVYRQDLKEYSNNGWALFGLMQSLEAQNKTNEAAEVKKAFEAAWKDADVTLTASRF